MALEIARRLVGGVWRTGPVEEANGGGGGGGSQPVTRVVFEFAFDTPDLAAPATGPRGIKICDLHVGDTLFRDSDYVSLREVFDGDGIPSLQLITTNGRGDLPTVAPRAPLASIDLTSSPDSDFSGDGELISFANYGPLLDAPRYVAVEGALWAYLDDGSTSSAGITIDAVNQGTKTFTLGFVPGTCRAGDQVFVTGSTGNDGVYTVASVAGSDVTVVEAIPNATADGTCQYFGAAPGSTQGAGSIQLEIVSNPGITTEYPLP